MPTLEGKDTLHTNAGDSRPKDLSLLTREKLRWAMRQFSKEAAGFTYRPLQAKRGLAFLPQLLHVSAPHSPEDCSWDSSTSAYLHTALLMARAVCTAHVLSRTQQSVHIMLISLMRRTCGAVFIKLA